MKTVTALIGLLISLTGCTIAPPPTTPPENYKGPVAEQPVTGTGDYWVYERADRKRVKGGAALLANLNFPLWIGKVWKTHGQALPLGQPPTSKATRIVTDVDVQVTAYKQVTVPAGTFDAFEIKFQCTIPSGYYAPDCGQWTVWYAPKLKNVVSIKTESTATSLDLVAYKLKQ